MHDILWHLFYSCDKIPEIFPLEGNKWNPKDKGWLQSSNLDVGDYVSSTRRSPWCQLRRHIQELRTISVGSPERLRNSWFKLKSYQVKVFKGYAIGELLTNLESKLSYYNIIIQVLERLLKLIS